MQQQDLHVLVEKLVQKDKDAFEKLYEMYHKQLYYLAVKYMQNKDEARDAVHDTFLSAFANIGQLKDADLLHSWMNRILVNKCLEKKKKSGRTMPVDPQENIDLLDAENDIEEFIPEAVMLKAELRQEVANMVEGLPERQKIAVLLYYFDEMKVDEISYTMDCTSGTVKKLLYVARTALKKQVEILTKQQIATCVSFISLSAVLKAEYTNFGIPADISQPMHREVIKESTLKTSTNKMIHTISVKMLPWVVSVMTAGSMMLSMMIGHNVPEIIPDPIQIEIVTPEKTPIPSETESIAATPEPQQTQTPEHEDTTPFSVISQSPSPEDTPAVTATFLPTISPTPFIAYTIEDLIGQEDAGLLNQLINHPQYVQRQQLTALLDRHQFRFSANGERTNGGQYYLYILEKGGKRLSIGEYVNENRQEWKVDYRFENSIQDEINITELIDWLQ